MNHDGPFRNEQEKVGRRFYRHDTVQENASGLAADIFYDKKDAFNGKYSHKASPRVSILTSPKKLRSELVFAGSDK